MEMIKNRKTMKNRQNGITLMALVITVIILLILAGISIGMLSGDNSILGQAGNAKKQTDIAGEKEILQISATSAMGKSKYGDITKEKLDAELDKNIGNGNYSSVLVDDGIEVTFTNSGRTYLVDYNGNVEKAAPRIVVDENSLAITNTDGSSITKGQVEQGTALKISFNASVQGGTVSISPSLPHTTTDAEIEAKKVNFTITGIVDGETIEQVTFEVDLDEYYVTPEPNVGDYVTYDVTYKDVNKVSDYVYGKNNGWRLLNKTKNVNGTYDIEIISSGVPVKLYYATSGLSNIQYNGTLDSDLNEVTVGTAGNWTGNTAQRTEYHNKFYVSENDNESNDNMYVATGLYYNFKYIIFEAGSTSTSNRGYYLNINGITSGDLTGAVFTTPKTELPSGTIMGVRTITLADIYNNFKKTDKDVSNSYTISNSTDKAVGLFNLNEYTPDSHNSGYYWLASPASFNTAGLWRIDYSGNFNNNNWLFSGIRPVILISGVILDDSDNDGIWEIK